MKTKILLPIFMLVLNTSWAQVDTQFWNPEMKEIAQSTSKVGWVDIKEDVHIEPQQLFLLHKAAFGLGINDEMILRTTNTGISGTNHYKFDHYYKGVKVEGSEYIVHSKNNRIENANGKLVKELNRNTIPQLTPVQVLEIAKAKMGATQYAWEIYDPILDIEPEDIPIPTLKLTRLVNDNNYTANNYLLVYEISLNSTLPTWESKTYLIDAINGDVLKEFNNKKNCNYPTGVAHTIHNGWQKIVTERRNNVNYVTDHCSFGYNGIKIYEGYYNLAYSDDNNWWGDMRERRLATLSWLAASARYYYKNQFDINSYDNNNSPIHVHLINDGLSNAFYNPPNEHFYFHYGSNGGSFSLDAMGHEMWHGVNERYGVNLKYEGETGALDESFGDIFGTMTEAIKDGTLWSNSGTDFDLGEDFGTQRSMSNPNLYGQPKEYKQQDYWGDVDGCTPTDQNDYCHVHINSGVQNYWFYLLAHGGSGTNHLGHNYDVSGLGNIPAQNIAWLTATSYLTSTSKYSDAKNASIKAASELYGACSWEVVQCIKAWDAVAVPSNGGLVLALTDAVVDCNEMNTVHYNGNGYYVSGMRDLESDCYISEVNDADVHFRAGMSVTLKTGFRGVPGFRAYLLDCYENIVYKNNEPGIELVPQSFEDKDFNLENANISIYPNPSSGEVNIDFGQETDTAINFEVFNVIGKSVNKGVINQGKITFDLSDHPKGMYIINMVIGESNVVKRIILE
jgi:bacillolysin